MKLCLIGHSFGYELEKLIRIFLPFEKIEICENRDRSDRAAVTVLSCENGITRLSAELILGENTYTDEKTLENSAGKLYNNLTFVPVKAVCAPLGYAVEWDGFYLIVRITAENVTVPNACKDFSYTQDDLLWLSRLVQIECGNESLATGIGVANTVLNRVASPAYPNTIREAILDTKHGVQYPPAHTEKMNCTPSKGSMIAAKCALNGVNLVGNAVAFVHVNALKSSWAANNMRRSATIGVVAFYEF